VARVEIVDATPPMVLAPLLREYLTSHLMDVELLLGVALDPEPVIADDLAHLDQFAAPAGCLLVARRGDELMGCVGLRPIEAHGAPACEIKRLYVRPGGRGLGLGLRLAEAVMARARGAGHRRVCLDTFDGMTEARGLYARLGFQVVAPYGESPVPGAFQHHWICMARAL
jgi:GNAT superfamily N-acetyltransferase